MNYKVFFIGAICLIYFTSNLVQSQETGGWKPLFSNDLSNADFPAGVWSFDGSILTATEDQNIWTKKDYENFILELEFKMEIGSNSGVLVYCTNTKDWVPNAVEVSILDGNSDKWKKDAEPNWLTGAIFGHQAPIEQRVKSLGKWNKIKITCMGQNIAVVLNGKLVTNMDMSLWKSGTVGPDGTKIAWWLSTIYADMPTKGKIGLQGKHGGVQTWFRKIRIKELI